MNSCCFGDPLLASADRRALLRSTKASVSSLHISSKRLKSAAGEIGVKLLAGSLHSAETLSWSVNSINGSGWAPACAPM